MGKLYQVMPNWSEAPGLIHDLLSASMEVAHTAYAPYSNFRVGSSLLTDDNEIITGANHENASYPLCMCAERVALYSLFSREVNQKINALAVYALDSNQRTTAAAPCGACRQVIREFEIKQDSDIEIYLIISKVMAWKFSTIKDLLPLSFDPSFFK